jgi:divalent metal cation (Fe/Co/Zn/Cd) transporter
LVTPEKLQRERAVFAAFIFDCFLIVPYFWVALQVGSLTLLGEVLRGVLLVCVAIASWLTLRRIHRGQTGAYDFGMGKVEQILSLLVAVLLCVSMMFVWYKALTETSLAAHKVDTLNVVAVVLAFLNLCANAAPLLPLHKAMKTGKSVLVAAQFKAKIAKTIGSVVVTACVALNQLSSNADLAWWADRAGVAIVTVVTLHAAYELLSSAIPDLLDRTLPEDQQILINQVLARHYDSFDALKWCQSRQSGSDTEVHVGLGFAPHIPFGEVARISRAVVDDIEAAIPGSRATVTPVLPD